MFRVFDDIRGEGEAEETVNEGLRQYATVDKANYPVPYGWCPHLSRFPRFLRSICYVG